jgi:predicted DNA binding CopG/RHH family protein
MDIRKIKLTKNEKRIERDLERGLYKPVSKAEHKKIAKALANRRKDIVLNIRVNSFDIKAIKRKAKRIGIPYQTFISEAIHRLAA